MLSLVHSRHRFMSCALLLWNLCEIVFVHYWKPHNRRLLNEVRERCFSLPEKTARVLLFVRALRRPAVA